MTFNRLVSFENFDNAAKIEILDLSALYTNITPYIVNLTRIKKVIYGNSKYASSVSANSSKGNTSIEYVDAGDYYTSIDYGAFWKCTSLKIVILNKNITVIDQRAFQDCTSMESCYIKATIPPALGTWAFDNNPCKIYVPHESVATYKAATNWNLYASRYMDTISNNLFHTSIKAVLNWRFRSILLLIYILTRLHQVHIWQ
ncbi:MAG: leucine-rich repeat protein [Bacteroides cellulosilyticus]